MTDDLEESDTDALIGTSIFDNGSIAVDAMIHPDGSLFEFQVFRWKSPRPWEDRGRWIMFAGGDPSQWPDDVPQTAVNAAQAWKPNSSR